ncbi:MULTISPECIES: RusA family crossover junction endodeoxyribonuclease [unclassified Microbacterium]|uniref:RusA family crossover junction endodeoxyribonuclease n=1 Tax=unclassified Microbacterium TaxID=2609290 RepID=UPI00300FBC4B
MTVIRVDGVPAPQGSKTRTRYGMFESSKRVKPWREAVVAAVKNMEPIAAPYAVTVHFFIPRPKKTDAAYPVAPAIGDVDKMLRATLDGLTQGGLIADDRFVIVAHASKQWAGADGPGAVIAVKQVAHG